MPIYLYYTRDVSILLLIFLDQEFKMIRNIIFFCLLPIIIIIIIIIICSGCNIKKHLPICKKDGQIYCTINGAFRDKWYNYYESGLSCMKGGCYPQATQAFKMAIQKRPEDERMARTYGMHLVDYFPHRELGIIYYLTNDYTNALKELNRSIQHEYSSKAIYYRDYVRTELLFARKEKMSIPELSLHQFEHTNVLWTHADPVIISGMAKDQSFIKKIDISDMPVFMEGTEQQVNFEEQLRLSEGKHELMIIVENLFGKTMKQPVTIHVDRAGPVIMIQKVVPNQIIEGFLYDDSGAVELFVDKQLVSVPVGKKVPFSVHWNNKNSIELIARDKAGNQTKALIGNAQSAAMIPFAYRWIASNDSFISDGQSECIKPPEIKIDDCFGNGIIFSDKLTISGHVFSQTEIQSLTIDTHSVIHEKGFRIFFSKTIPLVLGENNVRIKAVDQTGKVITHKLRLIRKQKEVFKPKYRMAIKLFPFELLEQMPETHVFYAHFLNALQNKNRFRMLVSNDFHDINMGIDLQKTGAVSDFYFLKGIIYTTERNGIEIVGRVFDHSSSLIDFVDIYEEFDTDVSSSDKFEYLAKRLSEKFHRTFPLLKGIVTQVSDKGCTISPQRWYHGKGRLRINWPILIYRPQNLEKPDISDTIILENSKIKRVAAHDCESHELYNPISIGNLVITQ
jgi:tetratricopeptide (TPR) repeat protein